MFSKFLYNFKTLDRSMPSWLIIATDYLEWTSSQHVITGRDLWPVHYSVLYACDICCMIMRFFITVKISLIQLCCMGHYLTTFLWYKKGVSYFEKFNDLLLGVGPS